MIYLHFIVALFFINYFKNDISKIIIEINNFLIFIHHRNPLLLQYYDEEDDYENKNLNEEEKEKEQNKLEEKNNQNYENKYLNKYKKLHLKEHTDEYLNKLVNNFIIEITPIGNVVMNYNHYKNSFEYFSNNTIPFRYLETISRKYVITYDCKCIFIDLNKEIEEANKINDKIKDLKIKPKMKINVNPTEIMKDYKGLNGPTPKLEQPFIAVKNSNRYTHKGRFSDFKITKFVQRSDVDKSLKLSFKEWNNLKNGII